jgi:hypothetical protein
MVERHRFDIFVCGHSADFDRLYALLPKVRPFGRVHVGSSYLVSREIQAIRPLCDVIHEPCHHATGYENFNLFCVRDLNRLARAPYFIKIDCDVVLADDWIRYVQEGLAERPEAVLFGTHSGTNRIEYDICGPLADRRLGGRLRVRDGLKVNGSFYVARRDFFATHDWKMQILHDLVWAFRDGRRVRPPHIALEGRTEHETGEPRAVRLRGTCRNRQETVCEDEMRSLTVHAVGAAEQMFVCDAGGLIQLPDKARPPRQLKLAAKWVRRRLGLPMYTRG